MVHAGSHDAGGPIKQQGAGGGSGNGRSCRSNTGGPRPMPMGLHWFDPIDTMVTADYPVAVEPSCCTQATILETERTSVAPVEEMGLPAGEEDDKGLLLVRCKTCARVLLAGSLAAHEEQCRSAPMPFRPAASPAPSSTTASMPASSGPASISQACRLHLALSRVHIISHHTGIMSAAA